MLSGATTEGAKMTMAALELGAFDFVLKPETARSRKIRNYSAMNLA